MHRGARLVVEAGRVHVMVHMQWGSHPPPPNPLRAPSPRTLVLWVTQEVQLIAAQRLCYCESLWISLLNWLKHDAALAYFI